MAFKFQLGAARLSGSLSQEGEIDVYDDSGNRAARIKENGLISGAANIKGAGFFTDGSISGSGAITGSSIQTANASLTYVGALSGASGISGSNLVINGHGVIKQNGNITGYADISGSGLVAGGNLSTLGTCDAVSGLGVDGTILLSDTKALQNVITISGAGVASAASVTINGNATLLQNGNVSAAAALIAATTVSGAGNIAGQDLNIGNSEIISELKALTNVISISGAGVVEAASININAGTSTAGGFEVSQAGAVSGAAGLQIGGTIRFDGAAVADIDVTADSFYFFDSDNLMKKDSMVDYADKIAGSGLTAANGVLSTQGSSVNLVSTTAGGVVLVEGYNVLPTAAGVIMCSLPSGAIGDVYWVKAKDGVSVSNYIVISSSEGNKIDGSTVSGNVRIESPYGAVGFLYADQSDWRIL